MRAPGYSSPTTDRDPEASRGLISSVVADTQRLIELEIALAKQEAKDIAAANGIAAGIVAFGGLLAILGVLVALPVMVVELVPWHWQAAGVWAAIYVVVGLLVVMIGKSRLRMDLPRRTLDSLKENKEWALRRVKSNGR